MPFPFGQRVSVVGSSSPFIRLTRRADHLADVSPRATWVQQKQWCCLVGRQPTCSALSRHRARDARGYDHIYTTATAMHDNEYPPSPSPPPARVSFELLKCTGIQVKTGKVGGGKCPTVCTLEMSYTRTCSSFPSPPGTISPIRKSAWLSWAVPGPVRWEGPWAVLSPLYRAHRQWLVTLVLSAVVTVPIVK